MSWIEVKAGFFQPVPDPSQYIEIFRKYGIENTLEDDRSLTGCLPEVEGAHRIAHDLAAELREAGVHLVSLGRVPDQDWNALWRQFFKPRRVGSRFLIQPSWEPDSVNPEPELLDAPIVLIIDPGQAFGTGDHATTRMCLELMEDLDLVGKHVADVGCGSGILAIAAAKLGAEVVASDIDPISIEVARQNAVRNHVEIRVEKRDGLGRGLRHGLPGSPYTDAGSFELVISNIITATIVRLAHEIEAAIEPGGAWIVSGILDDNWGEVEKETERLGFVAVDMRREEGWTAARLQRSPISQ